MMRSRKALIILENAIGALCALLAAVTIVWRDWIEIVFKWDPDHHSGAAEIGIIFGLALTGGAFVCIARWQNRRCHSPGIVPDGA